MATPIRVSGSEVCPAAPEVLATALLDPELAFRQLAGDEEQVPKVSRAEIPVVPFGWFIHPKSGLNG